MKKSSDKIIADQTKNNNDLKHKKIKKFKGIVVSNKMEQTIVVKVDRQKKHTKYKKYYKFSKKYHVHNPNNKAKIGNTVIFQETKPISKTKKWILTKILK